MVLPVRRWRTVGPLRQRFSINFAIRLSHGIRHRRCSSHYPNRANLHCCWQDIRHRLKIRSNGSDGALRNTSARSFQQTTQLLNEPWTRRCLDNPDKTRSP